MTVSVGGVSYAPQDEVDARAALEQADQAVYRAKAKGGNRVTFVGDED